VDSHRRWSAGRLVGCAVVGAKRGCPNIRHTRRRARAAHTHPKPWSFAPIGNPPAPSCDRAGWLTNPIDAFILENLEQNGLSPAPAADKLVLLRRACFDLLGLPMSPRQIDEFLKDDSPSAYERLIDGLRSLGVSVLINAAVEVERGGERMSIVGLTHHTDDLQAGVEQLLRTSRPRLAIIHEPDLVERLPSGSADLVLAGHTHGGQITLPGLTRIIAQKFAGTRYSEGFYHVNGMLMYVNRGLGTTGLPLRFRAMSEVTLMRLVR